MRPREKYLEYAFLLSRGSASFITFGGVPDQTQHNLNHRELLRLVSNTLSVCGHPDEEFRSIGALRFNNRCP